MNDSFSYFSVIVSTSDMEDSVSEHHDADIGSIWITNKQNGRPQSCPQSPRIRCEAT